MNRYERLNEERKIIEKRKRVAAYCRVSTDNEDQANSFESQQRYFRQYIERNPDWELYEILPMKAFLERAQKSVKSLTE